MARKPAPRTVAVMDALLHIPRARFAPGTYHTDGMRLFRIVCPADRGRLRVIEDCRTLELTLVQIGQLETMGLRAVATSSSESTSDAATAVSV
jgi:hypothetical protein